MVRIQSGAWLLSLLLLGCRGNASRGQGDNYVPPPSAVGSKTPIPNVRSIRANELGQLARAMKGKATLFNIWASWCGSCKGELPMLHALAAEYIRTGLSVVIVSVDEPEDYGRLTELAAGFGFSPPTWVASRPLSIFKSELAKNWMGNIPVTFLFDSHGKRRYFWDGPVEAKELRPVIDDWLAGKDVQGETHFALSAGVTDER